MRFAGCLRWKAAPASRPLSTPRALLGAGTVDCTPAASARTSLAAWWPTTDARRRGVSAAGASVLFAGYLRDVPPPHEDEAAYVLDRYRADDWRWLRAANGVFAFAVVDEDADRCVLGVDRLGIRPLFYRRDARGVTFAGTLAGVLAGTGPHEPDDDTLQELMVLGFPLSARSVIRGVERVPPGTVLDIRGAVPTVTQYWSLAEVSERRESSPLEVVLDESRQRLRHALSRLLGRSTPATLCLLSSGYDSRRLLLEARALGAPLDVATSVWPYQGRPGTTIEPAVTRALCERLGLSRRLVALPGEGGVEPRRARAVRDALLDFQVFGRHHTWSIPLVAAIPPSTQRANLDGIAGDTFLNNPFYSLPRALWGRWRPDADVLDAIAPERAQADAPWRGRLSCSLSARLEAALTALPEGPRRLSFFYLLGRTRAMVALLPFGLLDLRVESFCPYLDHDVMDHALSLDPVLTGERRLQRLALDRHFPAFADIPSSHSPVAEVPRAYLHARRFRDPDHPGRLTVPDVARLVHGAVVGGPRPGHRDVAFAVLSALGLGELGGGWREPWIRDVLQAGRGLHLLRRGEESALVNARAEALGWLDRWSIRGDEPD